MASAGERLSSARSMLELPATGVGALTTALAIAILVAVAVPIARRRQINLYVAHIQRILDVPPGKGVDLPVEIMPHLLLGDKRCAADLPTLSAFGITHMLNVAGTHGRAASGAAHVGALHYLQLHADDDEGYPILTKHLLAASAFIRTAREQGGRVLIHCQAGINRSGCIAVAELMLTERLPVLEAIQRVKAARGVLLSNTSFQRQLVELARDNGLLGPLPADLPVAAARFKPRARSAADALRRL